MPMMSGRGIADVPMKAGIAAVLCIAPIVVTLALAFSNAGIREALTGALPLLARYGAVLVLPALLLWALARGAGRRLRAADVLALACVVAFVGFAGIAQSAAYVLLLSLGLVIGSFLHRDGERSGDVAFTAMLGGVGVIALTPA